MTKDNNLLGKFELTGIPPASRGILQIDVTFELDANGILKVTPDDKGTGSKKSITVTNDKGRLSKEDIDRMIKEAEIFAEDDKVHAERSAARNTLEQYAYSLKSQIKDQSGLGGKLDEDDKDTIDDALKEVAIWLDSNAVSATKEDFEEQQEILSGLVDPITSKLYSHGEPELADDDGWYHNEL